MNAQTSSRMLHSSLSRYSDIAESSVGLCVSHFHVESRISQDYPHMPIGKVWIYRSLLVCLSVCTVTDFPAEDFRISPASYFVRRFIGVQGREFRILGNFAPQMPKIERIGERAGHAQPHVKVTVEMSRRKRHARDAPFVKSRSV